MAVTKIKPIKSTLSKALAYIQNPAKTEEKMLVSSFGCSYETADIEFAYTLSQASVYKGYKRDKIEMRGDRAEISDFPLYLNTVAGGLDRRDQTIGGFSFVVKIYAVPVVEIIG